MSRTKKLTQGAMLLAIAGALMIIDRQLSYFLETILILAYPVMIIVYSSMYTIKDGGVFCFGLLVMGFLFGSLTTHLYMPLAIIVGLGYSVGIKRNFSRQYLMVSAMALFIIGEIVITALIQPLLGLSIAAQLEELNILLGEYSKQLQEAGVVLDFSKLVIISFVFSIILMGIIEGFIVHLMSVVMLKRFKVKDIGSISLREFRISPPVAYISFLSLFMIYLAPRFADNDVLYYIMTSCYLAASVVLIFSGYMFVLVYGATVLRRNVTLLLIIFIVLCFPFSLFTLIVLGFLYGAGPLKDLIDRKSVS